MPLSLVAEVVANGGVLPQLAELSEKRPFLTKKMGVIFSVFFIITFLMLFPALFGIAGVDEGAAVSAVFGVFGGMMLIIGSLVFLPSSKPKYPFVQVPTSPQFLPGQHSQAALPPQQSVPASFYESPRPAASWRDTNDLTPGSVTEGTTRLLEKDEPRQ